MNFYIGCIYKVGVFCDVRMNSEQKKVKLLHREARNKYAGVYN